MTDFIFRKSHRFLRIQNPHSSSFPTKIGGKLTLNGALRTSCRKGTHGSNHEVLEHLVGSLSTTHVLSEVGNLVALVLGALEGTRVRRGTGSIGATDGRRAQGPHGRSGLDGSHSEAGGGREGRHCVDVSVDANRSRGRGGREVAVGEVARLRSRWFRGVGFEAIGSEDVMMPFAESFGRAFSWCLRRPIGSAGALKLTACDWVRERYVGSRTL